MRKRYCLNIGIEELPRKGFNVTLRSSEEQHEVETFAEQFLSDQSNTTGKTFAEDR